jgi:hypothetical protein
LAAKVPSQQRSGPPCSRTAGRENRRKIPSEKWLSRFVQEFSLQAGWRNRPGLPRSPRRGVVEVKTRTTDAFGPPHHAVTFKQQDRIIRGAKEWLRMLSDPRISYRFDVVEVLMKPVPIVTLIRGAFQVADDIYL